MLPVVLVSTKRRSNRTIYDALINGTPLNQLVLLTSRVSLDLIPAANSLAGAEVELVGMANREYRLKEALAPARSLYDYVIIDCPPSLGLLTVNALTASDGVIIPVQCEYLALEGLGLLVGTVDLVKRELNPDLKIIGLVMTMYDPRTNLAQQVVREVREHFPQAFRTIVPRSIRLSEAPSYGQAILDYDPGSKGAEAYAALAEELIAR